MVYDVFVTAELHCKPFGHQAASIGEVLSVMGDIIDVLRPDRIEYPV